MGRAAPVSRGIVGESAVTVVAHGAGGAGPHQESIEAECVSSIHICVIIQYANEDGSILRGRDYIIHRHRRIIDRRDGDGHCRCCSAAAAVVRSVGEGVRSVVVEVWSVGNCVVGIDHGRTVSRLADLADAERGTVYIRVVRKDDNGYCRVLICGRRVVSRCRRVVNRRHGNLYGCCLCGMAVCNRIGEGI